jgi:hypothetical protein
MSTSRIDCSVKFLGDQENVRDRLLEILNTHEPTWHAEPIEGYTSNGINVRPEWLVVWSVLVDNVGRFEPMATSIGRRVRDLVKDNDELLRSVGTAGVHYMLRSAGEPARTR